MHLAGTTKAIYNALAKFTMGQSFSTCTCMFIPMILSITDRTPVRSQAQGLNPKMHLLPCMCRGPMPVHVLIQDDG